MKRNARRAYREIKKIGQNDNLGEIIAFFQNVDLAIISLFKAIAIILGIAEKSSNEEKEGDERSFFERKSDKYRQNDKAKKPDLAVDFSQRFSFRRTFNAKAHIA